MTVTMEMISDTARELLKIAAGNQGRLDLLRRSDTRGFAVHAGNKILFDRRDAELAPRFVAALKELEEKLLLRGRTSEQFELTNHGWQLASKVGKRTANPAPAAT